MQTNYAVYFRRANARKRLYKLENEMLRTELAVLRGAAQPGKHWKEVKLVDIDQRVIDAARRYLDIIDRLGRGEMNLNWERTDAHDELIFELRRCNVQGIGYDFDGRANARDLAEMIEKWMRY